MAEILNPGMSAQERSRRTREPKPRTAKPVKDNPDLKAAQANGQAKAGGTGRRKAKAKPKPGWDKRVRKAVADLNEKHFVVTISGQTVIATLEHDDVLLRDRLVFSQERDIKLRYRNRVFHTGYTRDTEREIWKPLGDAWLEHTTRRTFERLALIPNGPTPPGTFNLWRGFGFDPYPGKWDLIEEFLLHTICGGDQANYDWLINWMARAVQFPGLPAETAVVLRGLKGTGKGTFATMMTRMFWHHALAISNPAHLTGRFNGHLLDVLFLFVDEAFWAGDKAGEGTLKALVTEPMIPIEEKFFKLQQAVNRLKILIASNADWVVPATHDERRYFVLDVPDVRRGDTAYFARLHQAFEGAELPAFMEYLLGIDLSSFDHRNPPHTGALGRQKIESANSVAKFWLDCLAGGEIVGIGKDDWPAVVAAQILHAAYVDHAHDHGERHPSTNNHMSAELAKLMPNKALRRIRPSQPDSEGKRLRSYALPSLDECRAAFLEAMKIDDYAWPEVEGE